MAEALFLIAAGGTGAKIVESFVHLCACGLGPEEAFILLVDGDKGNRAVGRADEVAKLYTELQSWGWAESGRENGLPLFKTRLAFYTLDQLFGGKNDQSLSAQLADDEKFEKVLGLFLSEPEMEAQLNRGFLGQPNLGSLVVSKYLTEFMTTQAEGAQGSGTAEGFTRQLIKKFEEKKSEPRIITAGSIFGGTGAAVIPCVESVLTDILDKKRISFRDAITNKPRWKWSSVMMLPYFNVDKNDRQSALTTKPERQPQDAQFALAYYEEQWNTKKNVPAYLVGSKHRLAPSRTIAYVDGGSDQYSPPFFQDLLAAIAVLDLYEKPEPDMEGNISRPFRHYVHLNVKESSCFSSIPSLPKIERVSESNMPRLKSEVVKDRLAIFLNLAAFVVRWDWKSDKSGHKFRQGLGQYAKSANITGWHRLLHESFRSRKGNLSAKGGEGEKALAYFGHLLLWAAKAFGADRKEESGDSPPPRGVSLLPNEVYNEEDYYKVHNAMCEFKAIDKVNYDANLAMHICSQAFCGMRAFYPYADKPKEVAGLRLALSGESGEQTGNVGEAIKRALKEHGLPAEEMWRRYEARDPYAPRN